MKSLIHSQIILDFSLRLLGQKRILKKKNHFGLGIQFYFIFSRPRLLKICHGQKAKATVNLRF